MGVFPFQPIMMLIGVVAIFCLLTARTELGVIFLLIGVSLPLMRRVAQLLDDSAESTETDRT